METFLQSVRKAADSIDFLELMDVPRERIEMIVIRLRLRFTVLFHQMPSDSDTALHPDVQRFIDLLQKYKVD